MPRPRSLPKYRKHSSGQARVTLVDAVTGRQRDVLLGKYGSSESHAEYGRVIQAWEASGRRLPDETASDLTINELIVAFMDRHVHVHFPDADGKPNHERRFGFPLSLRPLKQLYGRDRVADFGPLKLKAVQQQMVTEGLSRGVVNQRTWRIKAMFKWATEHELCSPSIYHGLQAVSGLKRGRTSARETEPVRPVAVEHVERTIPHMPPPVATLVRLQLLTGARPGELVIMRGCDLTMTGRVWIYRPATHKTAHHGHGREIYIGPKAQDVLRPWLKTNLQAFLFSPRDAEQERAAKKRAARKTKLWPSHARHLQKKRKATRRRAPKERYDVTAYARAITRACDLAFPPPAPLAKRPDETIAKWQARLTEQEKADLAAWQRSHRWHPHQLRHTAATLIRREHGLELSRIILGHSSMDMTELYAEADRQQALDVVLKIG